jgi:hypothetical protein
MMGIWRNVRDVMIVSLGRGVNVDDEGRKRKRIKEG